MPIQEIAKFFSPEYHSTEEDLKCVRNDVKYAGNEIKYARNHPKE